MDTVRQRIFEYVLAHRAVTVADISLIFRMTPANARRHLAILLEQNLIQVTDLRQTFPKGRPARVFAPSEQTTGNNLGRLASALLDLMEPPTPPQPGGDRLGKLAARMATLMSTAPDSPISTGHPSKNLTHQLNHLNQILNHCHYQSRWEARSDGPRIILAHCPYLDILADHPELCQLDALLIEILLERPVEQLTKLSRDSSGLLLCIFRLSLERL